MRASSGCDGVGGGCGGLLADGRCLCVMVRAEMQRRPTAAIALLASCLCVAVLAEDAKACFAGGWCSCGLPPGATLRLSDCDTFE